MMSHDEMIAVIAHHRDGGRIQIANQGQGNFEYTSKPIWDFNVFDYRPEPEPRILWVVLSQKGELLHSEFDKTLALLYCKEYQNATIHEYKEVLP